MEIETLLSHLNGARADRGLEALESNVWARIAAQRRRPASPALWAWRAAAAAVMLTIGALSGGAQAARAVPELSLFSPRADLAPSTLLEGAE